MGVSARSPYRDRPIEESLDLFRRMRAGEFPDGAMTLDRKSTRLNSSHANISYAVFCLKKKTWLLRSVFSSCCLARDFGLLPGWDTALPWSSAVLDW